MSFEETNPFFVLHRDLPREGPGEPSDVAWAANLAGVGPTAQIADVACGPGGDIAALLHAAPEGHVTALDLTEHFIDAARVQWHDDQRVTLLRADMARIHNTYDLIWCAGAVYFLGVTEALRSWRKSLRPDGVIAFSELCWFTDARPAGAEALTADYAAMTDIAGVIEKVQATGYEVLGTRRLLDTAWEAYLAPLDARIDALRPDADAALRAELDAAEAEAAAWRAHRDALGYLLLVVRPA